MRSIDNTFYKSKEWSNCRDTYIKEHTLCERCLANGLIVPAKIVHHKIHLNSTNVSDPSISLNHDNLESLCMECHNREHFHKEVSSRWSYSNGELQIKD